MDELDLIMEVGKVLYGKFVRILDFDVLDW